MPQRGIQLSGIFSSQSPGFRSEPPGSQCLSSEESHLFSLSQPPFPCILSPSPTLRLISPPKPLDCCWTQSLRHKPTIILQMQQLVFPPALWTLLWSPTCPVPTLPTRTRVSEAKVRALPLPPLHSLTLHDSLTGLLAPSPLPAPPAHCHPGLFLGHSPCQVFDAPPNLSAWLQGLQ